jgi:hypothetical protein
VEGFLGDEAGRVSGSVSGSVQVPTFSIKPGVCLIEGREGDLDGGRIASGPPEGLPAEHRRTRDTARAWAADGDDTATTTDPSALDRLFPHPVYGSLGWLAVLNPGPRSTSAATDLLRQAYEAARARYYRRHDA